MEFYAVVIQGEVVVVAQMSDETVRRVETMIEREPFITGRVVKVSPIVTDRFAVIEETERAIDVWRL